MLLAGVVLRNIPGTPVEGLPREWSSAIRAAGLSIILIRSGLELDFAAFKKASCHRAAAPANNNKEEEKEEEEEEEEDDLTLL